MAISDAKQSRMRWVGISLALVIPLVGAIGMVVFLLQGLLAVLCPDTRTVHLGSGPSGFVWRSTSPNTEPLLFSPDGRFACYTCITCLWRTNEGLRSDTLAYVSRMHWFPVECPADERSVPLDMAEPTLSENVYFNQKVTLQFSPDSKHLACASPNFLTFADVDTSASWKWCYAGERFQGMAWLSTDEVTFSTRNETCLLFWRAQIGASPDSRRPVHTEPGKRIRLEDISYSRLDWSPNGRYVLIRKWPKDYLLDIEEERMHAMDGNVSCIRWKPDGSAALVQYYDHWDKPYRYHLLELPRFSVADVTHRLRGLFGGKDFDVGEGWTPDGRFLIVQTRSPYRGWLVCPSDWRKRAIGAGIVDRLPVPGYVMIGQSGESWAVDYNSERRAALGNACDWRFSPDGRHAAEFGEQGIILHPISLPPLP